MARPKQVSTRSPALRLAAGALRRRSEAGQPGRIAVIDIGSNSIRLVAFQGLQRVPTPVFNEKVFCGLARRLGETGRLDEAGAELALKNLERFTKLAIAMGIEEVTLLATAAVREAEDGPAFAAEVERRCGCPVRILSGEQEGRLSAEGLIAGTPNAQGIMGDLGGGSLELVHLIDGRIAELATLPLGPLRLMDSVNGDPKSARRRIDEVLDTIDWLGTGLDQTFYAVGGAWRSMARISMESRNYPLRVIHGYVTPRPDLEDLARLISRQTKQSLSQIRNVSARRLETLPLAALVLRRVLRRVRPSEVMFSAFGLREGWLFNQLAQAERDKDPLLEVALDMASREGRFGDLGPELFQWTDSLFPEETVAERRLRRVACHFSDIAWREHSDYRASWSFERLLKWPFLAADHRERAFLAATLAWRYGGLDDSALIKLVLDEATAGRAKILGLALRLAYTLSAGTVQVLRDSGLIRQNGNFELHLPQDGSVPSGNVVERRFAQLTEALGEAGPA